MAGEIIIVVIALLFLVLGVVLFLGKGAWLIAGYNTASKEQQEQYDKKKLCRAAGCVCLISGILLGVMAYLGYRIRTGAVDEAVMHPFVMIFCAVLLVSIIAAIVYIHLSAKKR